MILFRTVNCIAKPEVLRFSVNLQILSFYYIFSKAREERNIYTFLSSKGIGYNIIVVCILIVGIN